MRSLGFPLGRILKVCKHDVCHQKSLKSSSTRMSFKDQQHNTMRCDGTLLKISDHSKVGEDDNSVESQEFMVWEFQMSLNSHFILKL